MQLEDLFKKLSLVDKMEFRAEYLNSIPQFYGNAHELNQFIRTCDSIVATFGNNTIEFINMYIINTIIDRLKGKARTIVTVQNPTTWEEIKEILLRNFSDQRDELCLIRELNTIRQEFNEKPKQYFNRILLLLNLLCNYVETHEDLAAPKATKKILYNQMALRNFLIGLKEPFGRTIRCMKPENLTEAMRFLEEEENIRQQQTPYLLNKHRNQRMLHQYQNPTPNNPNINYSNNNKQFYSRTFRPQMNNRTRTSRSNEIPIPMSINSNRMPTNYIQDYNQPIPMSIQTINPQSNNMHNLEMQNEDKIENENFPILQNINQRR